MLVGAGPPDEGADRRIHGVDSTTFAPTVPVCPDWAGAAAPASVTAGRPWICCADTMTRVNYPPPPPGYGYGYAPALSLLLLVLWVVLAVVFGIMAAS